MNHKGKSKTHKNYACYLPHNLIAIIDEIAQAGAFSGRGELIQQSLEDYIDYYQIHTSDKNSNLTLKIKTYLLSL